MRTKLVAGNWKMNGSRAQADTLLGTLRRALGDDLPCEVLVCPSYVYLQHARRLLEGSAIRLGAQNLSEEDAGAFTGEVSGSMLADSGCHYVLVGHSERRALFGEDSATVARKFVAAQRHGLRPVLCVGESLEQREAGTTEQVIEEQLRAVIDGAGSASLSRAVVAYEPVWAIGTGRTASPEQAQAVHAFVRSLIAEYDDTIADLVRILYGGSVKSSNAADLFSMPDVDGGLVGGASLDAEDFAGICRAGGT